MRVLAESRIQTACRRGCATALGDPEKTGAVVGPDQNGAVRTPRSATAVADITQRYRFTAGEWNPLQCGAREGSNVTAVR